MRHFVGDDEGYAAWLNDNATGFVLNVRSNPGASYAVLHRAVCQTINKPRDDGAYTGRGYSKVVSTVIEDLCSYALSLGRVDEPFSAVCAKCNPLAD